MLIVGRLQFWRAMAAYCKGSANLMSTIGI
jgi:hypothetical protein